MVSPIWCGRVAELADAQDLGSCGVIRAGSTPVAPTNQRKLWLHDAQPLSASGIKMSRESFESVDALEEALSRPSAAAVETMRQIGGDVLLLGVGGKMGPSLARMIARASDQAGTKRRIMGAARFSNPESAKYLERHGVETVHCDLLKPGALSSLPDAANVIYLAGMKFGATGQESLTWAMNTWLPSVVAQRFAHSRLVVFSTGNVYGLTSASGHGSRETDTPNPTGEYAMSCLGRERMFEHFSRTLGIPTIVLRLNYACDLRYGVLVDIARRIVSGEPVDLSMGWFNTIWQGDANVMTIRALQHTAVPPCITNMTGPRKLSVRETALELAAQLGREVFFRGNESASALLSDASHGIELLGAPTMCEAALIRHVAAWIKQDMPLLNKPTRFESLDGRF